jgi:hypothetical protein
MVWFRFNFFGFARKNRRLAARRRMPGHDLPDQQAKGNARPRLLTGPVNAMP